MLALGRRALDAARAVDDDPPPIDELEIVVADLDKLVEALRDNAWSFTEIGESYEPDARLEQAQAELHEYDVRVCGVDA